MDPVCLVMGAGAGIGGTVGRRFAREGYHAVLCRRANRTGLDTLVENIRQEGGRATGFILNAVEANSIEERVEYVENRIGPIEIVVFNLGAQTGYHTLAQTTLKNFELGWRLATFSLFRTARAICPRMQQRGGGTVLVTSATAAMRGNAGQHAHAPAMAARRVLCQSLNAEFAAHGVHIAHILVDGLVDAPDTTGKILGEQKYEALRQSKGQDGLIKPSAVAETYVQVAQQHRSAWTFELDLRAHSDKPWWND